MPFTVTPVSPTWFTDFFTELPNEFWRQAVPREATEAEVGFVEERLALAARGHRVTGSTSPPRRSRTPGGPRRTRGSTCTSRWPTCARSRGGGGFDAAICMGNSFGYLDLAGTREFVAALAGAVRPGGGLVIDFNAAAESVLPGHRSEPRHMTAGDVTMTGTTEYDVVRSRLLSHYRFSRGVEVVDVTAIHHVYTCARLAQLMTDAGFVDVEAFAGPDGRPFALGEGRLLLTARRTAP